MGLLDSFNLQDPSNALGLSLLAAGGPTTDPNASGFGARLAGAVQGANNMQDQALDRYLKRQTAAIQLAQARQKMSLLNAALGGDSSGGGAPNASAAPAAAPGLFAAAPGGASASPVVPASNASVVPAAAASVAPAGGGGIFNPRTAGLLRLAGEPDIMPAVTAMQPKWEFHDGVAIDVNPYTNPSFRGGPQGFISKSADGKVIQGAMGPDGQMHVAPVDGAVAAFNQFENASNAAKAKFTESRQSQIGADGRLYSRSVYDATQAPAAGMPPPSGAAAPAGGPLIGRAPGLPTIPAPNDAVALPQIAAAAQRELAASQADLQKVTDPASRALLQSHIADLQRQGAAVAQQMSMLPGLGPQPAATAATPAAASGARTDFANLPGQVNGAGGTGFSPQEKAVQAAAAAGAEQQAKLTAQSEAQPNDAMKASWLALQKQATAVPTALELLGDMAKENSARGVTSAGVIGTARNSSLFPSSAFESQVRYEKARSQVLPMVNALAAGGGDVTDNARDTAKTAVPEFGVDKDAQAAAIKNLENQFKAVQLRQQALAPHFNAGKGADYTALETQMNANLTPTVAGIVSMAPGPERNAAAQAAVKADPSLVGKLRWAESAGLLK